VRCDALSTILHLRKPAPDLLLARVKAYGSKYIRSFICSRAETAPGFHVVDSIKTSIPNFMCPLTGGGVFQKSVETL
jgi:hypothetical protein